jgi:hypothetical protein|tara:strand:- start:3221 stop:4462 length:1242 start_codon:yes stop_codon:yes gene_type:complete
MSTEKMQKRTQPVSSSQKRRFVPWLLLILLGLSTASPAYAASNELARPEFAMLIVSFLVLMGVTQAGVVFSATTRLAGAKWAKSYYRLADLVTMAFAPFAIAGFLLIYFQSKGELFYWLSPAPEEHLSTYLNSGWLLFRNLFSLLVFYGLSAVYFWKSLRPDLSGSDNIDHQEVRDQLYWMSPLIIIAYIVCNTFIAWDFGMMLIPHWHSTVFPIHYWFGNAYAATAALIVFPVLLGRFSSSEFRFSPQQIRYFSMLVSGFMLLWLYFMWAQFFVMWFGNLPRETDALFRQMYGHYAPLYWTMVAGCFFIPFGSLIFAYFNRSIRAMCVIALAINLGNWINKYLMVIPVYSAEDRIANHLSELVLSGALLAAFVIVVVLFARRLPVYSYWEINLQPNTSAPKVQPTPEVGNYT